MLPRRGNLNRIGEGGSEMVEYERSLSYLMNVVPFNTK